LLGARLYSAHSSREEAATWQRPGTGYLVLEIVQTLPNFSGKKEAEKKEVVRRIEFEITLNFVWMANLAFHHQRKNR
jgi:hypothetical protein